MGTPTIALQLFFLEFENPLWLMLLALLAPIVYFWQTSKIPASFLRRAVSLALRVALMLALIFSLCGTRLVWMNRGVCVLFLLDQSQSVGAEARAAVRQKMTQAIEKMTPDDQFAVIEFGGDAVLASLPGTKGPTPPAVKVNNVGQTDIARAIRLALASFPADRQKRILLFSDGNQNAGNALREAHLAAANGVDITTLLPVDQRSGHELMVEQVIAPPRVQKEAHFAVRAIITSDIPQKVKVFLSRDGNLLSTQEDVQLKAGVNVLDMDDSLAHGGMHQYSISVVPNDPTGDTFTENNRGDAFTFVEAPGKVLLVHGKTDDNAHDYLSDALLQARIEVETGGAEKLPTDLRGMMQYDCIILDNVTASYLTSATMAQLAQWVRDIGGGLVLIGGDDSFGPGGYKDTPLEDISPVDMDVKRKRHMASLALAVMVDKSGSMSAPAGGGPGVTKMMLANQGAVETLKLLDATDQANVGETDTAVKWMGPGNGVIAMTPANKRATMANTLSVEAGGGGIFCMTALYHAYKAVTASNVDAMSRHVILFADVADSEQQEDCVEMAARYYAMRPSVTTTVIGLGTKSDSDYDFQERLAKAGHGRHYVTNNALDLPRFFAKDAFIASRNAFVERKAGFPIVLRQSPLLEGLRDTGVPKLYGYVGTTLKTRATLAAYGLEVDDPVLAHWSVGLGKTVAFTSDATNHWSKDWVSWEGFAKFWTQTVRWASRSPQSSQLTTTTTIEGGGGRVVVQAMDHDGKPINDLQLSAKIAQPDATDSTAGLEQTAPGRYEATFAVGQKGTYVVNVIDRVGGGPVDVGGAVLSYPAEFRDLHPNVSLMKKMSEITGGENLADLDTIFTPRKDPVAAHIDLWEFLLLFAAGGLLCDIAWRRLNVSDWVRARPETRLAPTGSSLGAFKVVKTGTREVESQRQALKQRAATDAQVSEAPNQSAPEPTPLAGGELAGLEAPSTGATPAPTTEPATEGGYTNRLLSAKRRAAEQIKEQERKA